jgi:hypothetical protein
MNLTLPVPNFGRGLSITKKDQLDAVLLPERVPVRTSVLRTR